MNFDAPQMLKYIEASPSPYHCVAHTAAELQAAGFKELDERQVMPTLSAGECFFIKRSGSILAWRTGHSAPSEAGFRMMGAHTDSPNLRIKPKPNAPSEGYETWGVETYGGVLLTTWPDRDLGLAGRVYVRENGEGKERLFRKDEPLARIPNLAIHLNRGVNKEGMILNPQKHMPPMVAMHDEGHDFETFLSRELDVAKEDLLSWDLGFYDIQKPSLGGLNKEFVFSARLDNQASCFQALAALLNTQTAAATQVMVLFDHEEVGSRSAHGAMGAFFKDVLSRIERNHADKGKGGLERAITHSFLLSMDMAHGIHPNYADYHEPNHAPMMNAGPVIKEHAEQRYATDAQTSAIFRLACEAVNVPFQDFVIRTDLGCGSTIGPISSSQLGVRTIDVGNAMLSMHSIREQCGAKDGEMMVKALAHVLMN